MYRLFQFLILVQLCAILFADDSMTVSLNEEGHFVVQVTVTGPRGSLSFPAIIDTGASNTIIPRSIADGIGYTVEIDSNYSTAGGNKIFKVISVQKIAFLDLEFLDTEVAISENEKQNTFQNFRVIYPEQDKKQEKKETEELAVIGMSELSQTNFCYNEGKLTFFHTK